MNGDLLFKLMAVQTLQVTLLAGVVWVLTKSFAKDRPHLAHALWALVLLKCMTPPIIASPTSLFSWLSDGYATVVYKLHMPHTDDSQSLTSQSQVEGLAPVVVRISPDNIARDRVATNSNLGVSIVPAKANGRTFTTVAIYAWLSIAVGVLAVSALRLWCFLRRVRKATLPTSASLNQLAERISTRIGLRRKVHIRTVDAAIGPAVVGLVWPTILLPKVIVEGKSDADLEPLLAHELIHIRRGDLVWAMLQGMSVSLWWFNPLVWLAERLLTREAERSCDEETIASLACSPAIYARSLLDVMERKHQLRAAPSLPGVRPVDITAKRLERIMRLGHGCYRQRPWWVVIVWLIGCAASLPGGAWLTAQESAKQLPSVFKEAGVSSENRLQANEQEDRIARITTSLNQIEELAFQFEHVLELADVLERLGKERGLAKSEAEKELIRMLQPTNEELSANEAAAAAIKDLRKSARGISMRVVGNQLLVSGDFEKRKQIEQCIARYRAFGFTKITTEIAAYEVPRRLAAKDLTAISEKFGTEFAASLHVEDQGEITSDLGLEGSLTIYTSRDVAVLNNADHAAFKEWRAKPENADVKMVLNPQLISLSGQLASIEMGDSQDFIVSYELAKSKDGATIAVPVTEHIAFGSRYELRPSLAEEKDADNSPKIELSAKLTQAEIVRVNKSTQRFDGLKGEFEVERPIVRSRTLRASVKLGINESLVFVQTVEDKTHIAFIRCKPQATPAPGANLGNLPSTAYVSISDELQSDLEVALLKAKLVQLGITDFRIENEKIQVNVKEDWKAAVNAFQDLRANRSSTKNSTPKDSDQTKFNDGETTYHPIPLHGPFARQQSIPVLSQVPYVNRLVKGPVKLNSPSDDEIIQALEKELSQKGLKLECFDISKIKITTTKIKEYSDPARFVPLIGDSILHHAHYKCTLHDAATQELKNVVYVDYRQFQVGVDVAK